MKSVFKASQITKIHKKLFSPNFLKEIPTGIKLTKVKIGNYDKIESAFITHKVDEKPSAIGAIVENKYKKFKSEFKVTDFEQKFFLDFFPEINEIVEFDYTPSEIETADAVKVADLCAENITQTISQEIEKLRNSFIQTVENNSNKNVSITSTSGNSSNHGRCFSTSIVTNQEKKSSKLTQEQEQKELGSALQQIENQWKKNTKDKDASDFLKDIIKVDNLVNQKDKSQSF